MEIRGGPSIPRGDFEMDGLSGVWLFGAEGFYGVYGCGAAGGEVTGGEGG